MKESGFLSLILLSSMTFTALKSEWHFVKPGSRKVLRIILMAFKFSYKIGFKKGRISLRLSWWKSDQAREMKFLGFGQINFLIGSYLTISYRILSYLIVSYRILSYLIASYHIISYSICFVSYRIVKIILLKRIL